MRYWDASALVALVLAEPRTESMRRRLEEDASVVTWGWTRVELASAVERRFRDGLLTREERRASIEAFQSLSARWDEVADLIAVRSRALAVLARHSLRAGDAGQLAAALLAAEDAPAALAFVCLDGRLAEAAEREGLRVLV